MHTITLNNLVDYSFDVKKYNNDVFSGIASDFCFAENKTVNINIDYDDDVIINYYNEKVSFDNNNDIISFLNFLNFLGDFDVLTKVIKNLSSDQISHVLKCDQICDDIKITIYDIKPEIIIFNIGDELIKLSKHFKQFIYDPLSPVFAQHLNNLQDLTPNEYDDIIEYCSKQNCYGTTFNNKYMNLLYALMSNNIKLFDHLYAKKKVIRNKNYESYKLIKTLSCLVDNQEISDYVTNIEEDFDEQDKTVLKILGYKCQCLELLSNNIDLNACAIENKQTPELMLRHIINALEYYKDIFKRKFVIQKNSKLDDYVMLILENKLKELQSCSDVSDLDMINCTLFLANKFNNQFGMHYYNCVKIIEMFEDDEHNIKENFMLCCFNDAIKNDDIESFKRTYSLDDSDKSIKLLFREIGFNRIPYSYDVIKPFEIKFYNSISLFKQIFLSKSVKILGFVTSIIKSNKKKINIRIIRIIFNALEDFSCVYVRTSCVYSNNEILKLLLNELIIPIVRSCQQNDIVIKEYVLKKLKSCLLIKMFKKIIKINYLINDKKFIEYFKDVTENQLKLDFNKIYVKYDNATISQIINYCKADVIGHDLQNNNGLEGSALTYILSEYFATNKLDKLDYLTIENILCIDSKCNTSISSYNTCDRSMNVPDSNFLNNIVKRIVYALDLSNESSMCYNVLTGMTMMLVFYASHMVSISDFEDYLNYLKSKNINYHKIVWTMGFVYDEDETQRRRRNHCRMLDIQTGDDALNEDNYTKCFMTEWNFFASPFSEKKQFKPEWDFELSNRFYVWFDENFYFNIPQDTLYVLNNIKIKKLPLFLKGETEYWEDLDGEGEDCYMERNINSKIKKFLLSKIEI